MANPEKDLKHPTYGPGSFSDQYDNDRMKSMDRARQGQGRVTSVPIEDNYNFSENDYFPDHGDAYPDARNTRREGPRDYDLGRSEAGTNWNYDTNHRTPNFSGRGPRGYKRSDEKLLDQVCLVLQRTPSVDASDLEVSVEDGCAYLKGTLPNRGMRYLAEDLVDSIPGIVDVFTQIKIKES